MRYRPSTIVLVLVVGSLAWLLSPPKPDDVAARVVPNHPPGRTVSETPPPAEAQVVNTSPETAAPVPASGPVLAKSKPMSLAAMAEPPEGPEIVPGLTPVTVMENMRAVFRQYSMRLGGNPVGINRDITAALNGGNPRQIVFLDPEDGARLNDHGQLIDSWGTPFFFHQLSRMEMEIHSAGPDCKMWTADDLVIK